MTDATYVFAIQFAFEHGHVQVSGWIPPRQEVRLWRSGELRGNLGGRQPRPKGHQRGERHLA